jgi:FkbM family methyltransferase
MSWRTNSLIVAVRSQGRKWGVNRFVAKLVTSQDYEDKFQDKMLASVQSGDCVWDVGANLGLYTRKFAEIVGERGKVFAFEPSPQNFGNLKDSVSAFENIELIPAALGSEAGTVGFQQGDDPLGATSKVVGGTGASVTVDVKRGDDLLGDGTVELPNVVKIDTEGFELDVIRGMMGVIASPQLRTLCIEVHFGLLAERGQPDAPSEIEKLLKSNGFAISWPDSSHIMANRSSR